MTRRVRKDGECSKPEAESPPARTIDTQDLREEEFVRECCHCGTEIEFETDRCPICGTKLGTPDSGIVEFFEDEEFADSSDEVGVCARCGELVPQGEDECPGCGEKLRAGDDERIDPIIHTDKVVFLHLDVSTGELDYLKRLENRHGFGQATVKISTDEVQEKNRRAR